MRKVGMRRVARDDGWRIPEVFTKLSDLNSGLLTAMDQATNSYGPREPALSVNVAGRQRMLSKKMTREASSMRQNRRPSFDSCCRRA